MSSLKRRATSAVLWDLGGTFSQQAVGFVISIFLARLLEPRDFGIVSMSLVFITIFQVFTDFGFASALIQNEKNTSLTYSSVFYINVIFGLALFLIFQGIAPVVGDFYKQPIVAELVRWTSLSFIFSSLNIVQRTILRRNIDFRTLTIRGIISQVGGGVVGVALAFRGYGVYALVFQNISSSLLNTMILWRVTDWYPRFEFSLKEVKKLSGFSAFMFLDQFVSTIFNRLDVLFIAKVFSPTTLGFYSRADSVNNLVAKYSSSSITKVFFPVLSKMQNDDAAFERTYRRIFNLACFVSFGLTGVLFLLGQDVITVLFGNKWMHSVFIFQILVLKAFSFPVNTIMITAFISKGKSRENFVMGLARKSLTLLPYIIGYFQGLSAFLLSVVFVNYLTTVLNIFYLDKILGLSTVMHLRELFSGAVIVGLFVALYYFSGIDFTLLNRILATIGFCICYLLYNVFARKEGFTLLFRELKSLVK